MSNNSDTKQTVADHGGIVQIVQALTEHPADDEVQMAALLAIISLSVKATHRTVR